MNRTIAIGATLALMTAAIALVANPAQATSCKKPVADLDAGHVEEDCGTSNVSCDVTDAAIGCQVHVRRPPVPSP